MQYLSLVLTLCVGLLLLSALGSESASRDCAEDIQAGAYGVPLDEPAVRAGALVVPGFAPIYLEKRKVEVSDPSLCTYVTTYDVFRLTTGQSGRLLAGCYGDFSGVGRRDYALLLREFGGARVVPYVFLARPPHYVAFALGRIVDPYGFGEDRSLWPGPFCHRKPGNGMYRVLEGQMIRVVGDVIQVGWYAYYWLPAEQRFQDVLIAD